MLQVYRVKGVDATQVHDVLKVPTHEDINPGRRSQSNMKRVGPLILLASSASDWPGGLYIVRAGFCRGLLVQGPGCLSVLQRPPNGQTAAHLVDHVIPPVPVRQWVISVPKRLRASSLTGPRGRGPHEDLHRRDRTTALYCGGRQPVPATGRAGSSATRRRLLLCTASARRSTTTCICTCVQPTASSCRLLASRLLRPPAFLPARPITQADLATITERVRRRVIRWFRLAHLLDASAAADMLAWENSGFSIDASVRISLIDRDVPSYFQSLEHLLRYCARPPFALERLSVIRGPAGRIAQVRYVLPRHKAANWVGRDRGRKSTRPGANGVVELTPFEFLDRLADLVPPPRKHRHRYHGVFAPNHKLRPAVTALAIGNIGKRREAVTGGHAAGGHAAG